MTTWLSRLLKKNPGVEHIHCDLHNLDIYVYPAAERKAFLDDNCPEVAVFEDEKGSRSLKRYVQGKCDLNCPTVRKVLEKLQPVEGLTTID